ncbi:DUF5625 family protein [Photorhabdus namnaonensis]|uniref:DUF5625 domain-containing protein n=1 Tax=Photorhabdus namnaonensis TaxID=1851568 RepID=A0A1B8YCB7_9GAMM|nr:DUF5625 family protein [Photorhabdus namnaonensis]OCA52715.1 hypothetical protein Phpb_04307 [Photorhabdus namnaonensis]
MKVLRVHERFKNWQNIIIFMSCALLIACSKPIDIYKPIDVSKSGQSVKIDFEISKVRDYQFALLFAAGDGHDEMERRFKLFGDIGKDGVVIPVLLRLVKDGQVLFDGEIKTLGTGWEHTIHYKKRKINTAVRDIEIFKLPLGRYSAVITTLEDVPAFHGIESFVQLTHFPNV